MACWKTVGGQGYERRGSGFLRGLVMIYLGLTSGFLFFAGLALTVWVSAVEEGSPGWRSHLVR